MFTTYDIIYFSIYITCLCFSLKAREDNIPGLSFLRLLLYCGLLTEVAVEILQWYKMNSNSPYYLYIPAEYILLVLFYAKSTARKLFRRILFISTGAYLAACILVLTLDPSILQYPAWIYNISCLLNTIWVTLLFLEMQHVGNVSITRQPQFWIYTAFLLFFSTVFFFNGPYLYLLKKDSKLAETLRNMLNVMMNYVLYLLLTYAFICSIRMKRSSSP